MVKAYEGKDIPGARTLNALFLTSPNDQQEKKSISSFKMSCEASGPLCGTRVTVEQRHSADSNGRNLLPVLFLSSFLDNPE